MIQGVLEIKLDYLKISICLSLNKFEALWFPCIVTRVDFSFDFQER